ncbi:MAG TPA: cellulase family glycosylhydrolase, partial [Bacteroidia bacterium]|nr:cellulase family glycosylhydrolase [Bacteroidia bacterium]
QQMGDRWTRFDFEWGVIEPEKNTYDFGMFDFVVEEAEARGIKLLALLNLNAAPEWQRSGGYLDFIDTPANYAHYVGKVAEHFKGKVELFELGNEPSYHMDVETYTEYLKAGYTAVKKANPDAKVITAGTTYETDPVSWVNGLYENGAKGYFDYLGYHPYTWPEGPDAPGFTVMKKLRDIMAENNDFDENGQVKEIMATEFGWPTTKNGGVSEDTQAKYLVDSFTNILIREFPFIAIAFWYDLINDHDGDSVDPENNFGLYDKDYNAKPAVAAFQQESVIFSQSFSGIAP